MENIGVSFLSKRYIWLIRVKVGGRLLLIVDELWKHIRLIKLRSVEDDMEPCQLNASFSSEWRFDLPSKRYTYDKDEA